MRGWTGRERARASARAAEVFRPKCLGAGRVGSCVQARDRAGEAPGDAQGAARSEENWSNIEISMVPAQG